MKKSCEQINLLTSLGKSIDQVLKANENSVSQQEKNAITELKSIQESIASQSPFLNREFQKIQKGSSVIQSMKEIEAVKKSDTEYLDKVDALEKKALEYYSAHILSIRLLLPNLVYSEKVGGWLSSSLIQRAYPLQSQLNSLLNTVADPQKAGRDQKRSAQFRSKEFLLERSRQRTKIYTTELAEKDKVLAAAEPKKEKVDVQAQLAALQKQIKAVESSNSLKLAKFESQIEEKDKQLVLYKEKAKKNELALTTLQKNFANILVVKLGDSPAAREIAEAMELDLPMLQNGGKDQAVEEVEKFSTYKRTGYGTAQAKAIFKNDDPAYQRWKFEKIFSEEKAAVADYFAKKIEEIQKQLHKQEKTVFFSSTTDGKDNGLQSQLKLYEDLLFTLLRNFLVPWEKLQSQLLNKLGDSLAVNGDVKKFFNDLAVKKYDAKETADTDNKKNIAVDFVKSIYRMKNSTSYLKKQNSHDAVNNLNVEDFTESFVSKNCIEQATYS